MMSINLKEIEKRAFRSIYQDGLWDIYYGLIVVFMAVFMDRPESGFSPVNILLMVAAFAFSYLLFWLGKKFITLPRLGEVKFGSTRKLRKRNMIIVLGIFVLFQLAFLVLSIIAWRNPIFAQKFSAIIGVYDNELMIVSLIGAFFVGSGMILIAFFSDFERGYYIAILMALAVFLILYFDRPVFPLVIGLLIILPGIWTLIHFLKQYPLNREDVNHG